MATCIAVTRERRADETRVAATPETVKRLASSGFSVVIEAGAGAGARIPDEDYAAAGAKIAPGLEAALKGALIVREGEIVHPALTS